MAYAPSEDSDQPGHLPNLIRVFAVCMKKPWVLSYTLSAQRRLWSDWADAQADLSLRWMHSHFVCFVMLWLKWFFECWIQVSSFSSVLKHFKEIEKYSFSKILHSGTRFEPRHEKTCFCHMRTTKAQISMHIRAVWSAPLLFAAWIV